MRLVGRENRTTPIGVTSAPADHLWAICTRARCFNGLLARAPDVASLRLNKLFALGVEQRTSAAFKRPWAAELVGTLSRMPKPWSERSSPARTAAAAAS